MPLELPSALTTGKELVFYQRGENSPEPWVLLPLSPPHPIHHNARNVV